MSRTQRITLNDNADIRVVDNNFQVLDEALSNIEDKLESVVTITIPADTGSNYETLTDKDGVDFYCYSVNVTGMTDVFNGTQPLTPKMVDPRTVDFSIAEWEDIRDNYFPLIMSCWSRNGYIEVFMYDLPDIDFDVNLYGV